MENWELINHSLCLRSHKHDNKYMLFETLTNNKSYEKMTIA
jgi:hypothetical protein